MARPAKDVLEGDLGTKVFFTLLYEKDNPELTGYDIAKKVYEKKKYSDPNKVYVVLKELKEKGLVDSVRQRDRKRPTKFNRISFTALADYLNDKLPPENRLNKEERKEFASLLERINYKAMQEQSVSFKGIPLICGSFDNLFGLFLSACARTTEITYKINFERDVSRTPPQLMSFIDCVNEFRKLPHSLIGKILILAESLIDTQTNMIMDMTLSLGLGLSKNVKQSLSQAKRMKGGLIKSSQSPGCYAGNDDKFSALYKTLKGGLLYGD